MKKMYKVMAKTILIVFALMLFFACEDEISTTGAGIVNQVNFETEIADNFSVVAYNRNFPEGIQTNGIPQGVLGIYDDPVYGKTTASFLSQVTLSRFSPEFGENPQVESVFLTIPYFSRVVEIDDDGEDIRALDSVFANTGAVKLSVYRSNFFLNDLDPNTGFEDPAVYVSDDISNPMGAINQNLLQGELIPVLLDDNGIPLTEEIEKLNSFRPTADLIATSDSTSIAPALRVELDPAYWQDVIIDQEGNNTLINPNSFNDYFRGLFFKIEPIDGNGHYTIFNLVDSNITINYTFEGDDDSGEPGDPTNDGIGEIQLIFSGVSLVDYQNDFNPSIIGEINNSDDINGEANLYLKGGNGSIAIVDLFGPRFDVGNGEEFQSELEILRDCGIIINEANLILYVDQIDAAAGLGELEPERLFVYDFDNNRSLIDGVIDNSGAGQGAVNSRTNHLGRLVREQDDVSSNGVSYRIRLTQHLNNIIQNDSTNVRLAVAVTQNVLIDNTALIAGTGDQENGKRVPIASVISPEGTIIHGNLSTDELKKLRLRINYTLTQDIDPDSPCGLLLGLE